MMLNQNSLAISYEWLANVLDINFLIRVKCTVVNWQQQTMLFQEYLNLFMLSMQNNYCWKYIPYWTLYFYFLLFVGRIFLCRVTSNSFALADPQTYNASSDLIYVLIFHQIFHISWGISMSLWYVSFIQVDLLRRYCLKTDCFLSFVQYKFSFWLNLFAVKERLC